MRSIVIAGLGHISATQLMAAHALASAHNTSLTILPPHITEPKIDMEKIVKEFKAPDIVWKEPFFPKESAWERRNPNQPFYSRFRKNQRH